MMRMKKSGLVRDWTQTSCFADENDITKSHIITVVPGVILTTHGSKTPYVVTVLWQDSDDVVTILSPTRNLVEGYKTV